MPRVTLDCVATPQPCIPTEARTADRNAFGLDPQTAVVATAPASSSELEMHSRVRVRPGIRAVPTQHSRFGSQSA